MIGGGLATDERAQARHIVTGGPAPAILTTVTLSSPHERRVLGAKRPGRVARRIANRTHVSCLPSALLAHALLGAVYR